MERENRKLITLLRMSAWEEPPELWRAALRASLLRRARSQAVPATDPTGPKGARSWWIEAFAFSALLLLLSVGASATIVASRQALPDNTVLYAMKLGTEEVERLLTRTPEEENSHAARRAQTRLEELRELTLEQQPGPSDARKKEVIAQTVRRYAQALQDATLTVSRLGQEGRKEGQLSAAVKLEKTIRDYRLLLNSLDQESEIASALESAKELAKSAEQVAHDIITKLASPSETTLGSSTSTPPSATSVKILGSPSPAPAHQPTGATSTPQAVITPSQDSPPVPRSVTSVPTASSAAKNQANENE